jgi:anaerobic magnesium-protoporphyrin IX monomethyl ester cyclase
MAQRVLLINPYYPITETPSPPLGLAYLAGALEAAGVSVQILDLVVMPKNATTLSEALNGFQPDMVGVTAVTMSVETAFALVREVKALAPEVLTVMGGPHVTFSTEATLAAVPALDVIVRGEGERTLLDLLAESDPGRWGRIPGLAFRENGEIRHTPWREPETDLGRLPDPARHGLPLGRYRTLGMPVSVTTSRGCPFQCAFCVGRRMVGARVRYRPPLRVVEEIAGLAALGFRQVNLADDLFTANPRHCLAICDEILRRDLTIRWSSFARVDTVSVALLTRMREAGCHAVSFGIESGCPDILKRVRKKITLAQVEAAVAMCRQAGLEAHASFILGLPGETPDTLEQTMSFARRLGEQGLSYGFHLLAPFPGTAIGDDPESFGLQVLSRHWPDYHANRAICLPKGMDPLRLDAIADGWQTRFLDYLADIQKRMPSGDASEEEAALIHNMNRTAILYDMMMAGVLEKLAPAADQEGGAGHDDTRALDALSHHVARQMPDWSRNAIRDALGHAWQRDGLRLESTPTGQTMWRWVDYLSDA